MFFPDSYVEENDLLDSLIVMVSLAGYIYQSREFGSYNKISIANPNDPEEYFSLTFVHETGEFVAKKLFPILSWENVTSYDNSNMSIADVLENSVTLLAK